jgi:uncharacterized protein (TIGR03437 family)
MAWGETVYVLTGAGNNQVSSNILSFTLLWDAPDIFVVGYECPIDGQAVAGDLPAPGTNCALSSTDSGQPNIMPLRGTITDTNGRLVDSANPAVVGGSYTMWLTGVNFSEPAWILIYTPSELVVGVGGWQPPLPTPTAYAEVGAATKPTFAGPSPQFPGLSQINFQIPTTITGGAWPCGSYSWEVSVGIPSIIAPGVRSVQIPLRIGPTDVPCVP